MQEAMTGAGLAEAGLTPHNNLSQTETPIEKMTQKRAVAFPLPYLVPTKKLRHPGAAPPGPQGPGMSWAEMAGL